MTERAEDRRVKGFEHVPPQTRERLVTEEYEYRAPFNYENIVVHREYLSGQEHHGVEINPVNSIGADDDHLQPDTITVEEEHPIVRVVVIGSACQPPGFINLEAFPTEEFYKPEDPPGTYAPRFRAENLWGMHLRAGTWLGVSDGPITDNWGRQYGEIPEARKELKPVLRKYRMKSHLWEHPLAGMSCATFEIPKSKKIAISGGSQHYGWSADHCPDDIHYSFNTIRVCVDVHNG